MRAVGALLGSAHPGPVVAVTSLTALLAVAEGLPAGPAVLVVAAVLAGQLSIGWSNDLVDLARDQAVGRDDKPLASGAVSPVVVRAACGLAVVSTVVLSLACGLLAGTVHLGLVVMGWLYNLRLKSTGWSWLPYAVAFGGLPVFVSLAAPEGGLPEAWLPLAAALLGVGAHVVNVLPDLADDAATGVRGWPHRLGERRAPAVAVVVLALATLTILLGARVTSYPLVAALLVLTALSLVAFLGRGRTPFRAAVGIAVLDVVLLVLS